MPNVRNWNKKWALLTCSLVTMMPFRMTICMARLCVTRFNLDSSHFRIYLSRMVNAMMIAWLLGNWLGVIFTTGWATGPVKLWVVAVANWAELACLCCALFCFCHSEGGHLTGFYWSMAIANFWWKVSEQGCMSIGAADSDYYVAGYTLSGTWSALLKTVLLMMITDNGRYDVVGKPSVKTTVEYRAAKWFIIVTIVLMTLACLQWTAIAVMLTMRNTSLEVEEKDAEKEKAVEALEKALNGWKDVKSQIDEAVKALTWTWAERDSSSVGDWTAHRVSFSAATVNKVTKSGQNWTITVTDLTYQTVTGLPATEWWSDASALTGAVKKLSVTWTKTKTEIKPISPKKVEVDLADAEVKLEGSGTVTFTVHVDGELVKEDVKVKGSKVKRKFKIDGRNEHWFDFDHAYTWGDVGVKEGKATVTLAGVRVMTKATFAWGWDIFSSRQYNDVTTPEMWEKAAKALEESQLLINDILKENVTLTVTKKNVTITRVTTEMVDFNLARAQANKSGEYVVITVNNVNYKEMENQPLTRIPMITEKPLDTVKWNDLKADNVRTQQTVEAEVKKKFVEELVTLMRDGTDLTDKNVTMAATNTNGQMTIKVKGAATVESKTWQTTWQTALTKGTAWQNGIGLNAAWTGMETGKNIKKMDNGATAMSKKSSNNLKKEWEAELARAVTTSLLEGAQVKAIKLTSEKDVTITLSGAATRLNERIGVNMDHVKNIGDGSNTLKAILKHSWGTYSVSVDTANDKVTYATDDTCGTSSSPTETMNDLTICVGIENKTVEFKNSLGGWELREDGTVNIQWYNKAQNILVLGKALTLKAETWMSVVTGSVMAILMAVPFAAAFAALGRYSKWCGQAWLALMGAGLGALAGGGGSLGIAVTRMGKDSTTDDLWDTDDKNEKVWICDKAWTWVNDEDWSEDTKTERTAVKYGPAIGLLGGASLGALTWLCVGVYKGIAKTGLVVGTIVGGALGTIVGTLWRACEEGKMNADANAPLVTAGSMAACVLGQGTVYPVYPVMAPYSITNLQYFDRIDIWILSLSAICPIVILGLDMFYDSSGATNWKGQLPTNLSTTLKGAVGVALVLLIAQITCQIITICVLQYPDSDLAKAVTSSPWLAGGLTVTMVTSQMTATGIGFSGVFAGSGFNVGIQKLNYTLTLLMGEFTCLFSYGYLTELTRYEPGKWPTQGMDKWESWKWWSSRVFSNAWQVSTCICTKDLRRDIMLCKQ